jgi:hypothetical protein
MCIWSCSQYVPFEQIFSKTGGRCGLGETETHRVKPHPRSKPPNTLLICSREKPLSCSREETLEESAPRSGL